MRATALKSVIDVKDVALNWLCAFSGFPFFLFFYLFIS
jgi:hypothetical protein